MTNSNWYCIVCVLSNMYHSQQSRAIKTKYKGIHSQLFSALFAGFNSDEALMNGMKWDESTSI